MKYTLVSIPMAVFIRHFSLALLLVTTMKVQAWHCDNSALAYQAPALVHPSLLYADQLSLLVWNVYKQKKPTWAGEFIRLSQDQDMLLLQEAGDSLMQKAEAQSLHSYQVQAFSWRQQHYGVMNLSTVPAATSCAQLLPEPWLRVAKSALLQRYAWQQHALLVVNLHSINFTIGLKAYQQQLAALSAVIAIHRGPVVVAGDFNTWSDKRKRQLQGFAKQHNLRFAKFEPDHRTRINGRVLDHILYRGLSLIEASSPLVAGSDHQPMLATFVLQN